MTWMPAFRIIRESCLPAVRFMMKQSGQGRSVVFSLLGGSCNTTETPTDGSCGVPDIDSVDRRIYRRVHGPAELDCGDIPAGLG